MRAARMPSRPGKPRRVAIVHPVGNLDSVPSLRNAATLLAEQGYWVDIYTRFDDAHLPPAFDHERISLLATFEGSSWKRFGRLIPGSLYQPAQALLRHWRAPYVCLIGVDPRGLLHAKSLARWIRAPLVYYSLELLLSYEATADWARKLKAQEKALTHEAAFVIIQDEERANLLARDNDLAMDRMITVPNAPLGCAGREPSDFLRKRFSLPADTTIILHAGSIGDWACTRQLIQSTHDWPDDWVLIFHTRKRLTRDSPLLEQVPEQLAGTRRILVSTDPVPHGEYPSLVRSADIGVAFYCVEPGSNWTQDNIRHIGLSSGKLAYYLQAGVPAIVNDIPSLRRLTTAYRCGEVVSAPSATYSAVERILSDYESYSRGALECFSHEFNFASSFQKVLDALDRL